LRILDIAHSASQHESADRPVVDRFETWWVSSSFLHPAISENFVTSAKAGIEESREAQGGFPLSPE
jgi:hypothetical protein